MSGQPLTAGTRSMFLSPNDTGKHIPCSLSFHLAHLKVFPFKVFLADHTCGPQWGTPQELHYRVATDAFWVADDRTEPNGSWQMGVR